MVSSSIDFCPRWRCRGFSGRCRVQERAKSRWWRSLHLSVTGEIVIFLSGVFVLVSLKVNVPSAPLQPVRRWNLPITSVCAHPGGWDWGVWLRSVSHRRQTSRSQDSGDQTNYLIPLQNWRWRYSEILCWFFLLFPLESSKWFSAGGLPFPDYHTSAAQGHGFLSSKSYDWSAVVLHQEQW